MATDEAGVSRFDASTPSDRRSLMEAAIEAHRERSSAFCTFEPDEGDVPDADDLGVPWVQCSGDRCTFDCTESELDRAKALLEDYSGYRIEAISRPEEAEGAHVAVSAPGDLGRRAAFVDDLFTDVFELSGEFRLWVVAV